MSTLTPQRPRERAPRLPLAEPAQTANRAGRHWLWLLAGFVLAFAVPFLLADTLELERDLYYGLYALGVAAFVAAWARDTRLGGPDLTRNWRWGLALGALGAVATALVVLRTEDATDRPAGLDFVAAILWRGVVYGATDGLLLSVFPILAVFGALAGVRQRRGRRGTLGVGAVALLASLGITAAYHLGYQDFRSEKLRRPVAGGVLWSAPTLLTLSPLGAPIAHVGLHVTAVAHSSETDLFLPPHRSAEPGGPAGAPERHAVRVYFLRGELLAPVARTVTGAGVATAAMQALLAGPTAVERGTGIGSTIPAGTSLRSVTIASGTATVDLSRAYESGGGSLSMAGRLAQVTYTLTQFPAVRRVEYRLQGAPLTVLGGEGIVLDEPQTRAQYEAGSPDSLERSLLGPVFVDTPAQGASFASPLRVTGSATVAFTLMVADWDGRIVAQEEVRPGAFDVTLEFDRGPIARGTLIASGGTGAVVEVPLGS